MVDWPDNLLNDLARRRTVLTIGSGVSRHATGANGSRPPTWKDFLSKACDECPHQDIQHIRDAITQNDYLHACEWLKSKFDENWSDYLRSVFSLPGFKPSKLHDLLISLDTRIVFSLNFDDIYERAASSIKSGAHVVKNYHDNDFHEFLRGGGRYIVKVHGNLNSPNSLIFTQREYSEARIKHSAFYQAFDSCLMTHSFLFVGAGISDPDVNLILENQNFAFPSSAPHYFLTGNRFNEDQKNSLKNNRNLKIIEYDPLDDAHSGLVDSMKDLSERINDIRATMGQQDGW